MATIHYYEIYTEEPMTQPPVLVALGDLRKQRWSQEMGRRLRLLTKAIQERIDEIGEERKRLLTVHARRGENGEPVEVKSWADLSDRLAFQTDFQQFLEETFEVPGLPFAEIAGRDLLGETWVSPLLEDGKPVEKKDLAAGGGGGSGEGGMADN